MVLMVMLLAVEVDLVLSHAKYAGASGLNGDELGYQLLDTRFTGSSAHNLSGAGGYWDIRESR
jgi:hypothetical protein